MIHRLALVHIAREVENAFVGVQCGIMDQFTVALGARGQGIHLDCDSLDYALVPLEMDGYEIVITDSGVPRKLAESAYNERRNECRLALEALRQVRPFERLCAATVADVDASAALRALPVVYRRARHVVAENERVALAADALRRGELERFGRLLYASHESLRDDFEVSCRELDILVETAMSVPGVLGARMTGAGFGGCMFALVAAGSISAYVSAMHAAYSSQTPYEARMIRCGIGDGVKRLDGTGSGSDSDATAR